MGWVNIRTAGSMDNCATAILACDKVSKYNCSVAMASDSIFRVESTVVADWDIIRYWCAYPCEGICTLAYCTLQLHNHKC